MYNMLFVIGGVRWRIRVDRMQVLGKRSHIVGTQGSPWVPTVEGTEFVEDCRITRSRVCKLLTSEISCEHVNLYPEFSILKLQNFKNINFLIFFSFYRQKKLTQDLEIFYFIC